MLIRPKIFVNLLLLITYLDFLHTMDIQTPKNTKLNAFYKQSFAHYTIKERLPVILTKIIDHLVRDRDQILNEFDYVDNRNNSLKEIIGEISKLKYEIQTNKALLTLTTNATDVPIWNKYLEELSKTEVPTYFNTPWLYAETYMYRRLKEIFDLTPLKNFDPFRKQKIESFHSALQSIIAVSSHLLNEFHQNLVERELENLFSKLMKLSLWGNKCDLSLSLGTIKDTPTRGSNPLESLEEFNESILVNDIETVWDILNKFNTTDNVVTIVTDNAGYELFTDLCLADFLIASQVARRVNFNVKSIPWYISDVTLYDFHWVIDSMYKSNHDCLSQMGKRWKGYLSSKQWTVESDQFWTLPFGYSKMKTEDPELYLKLSESKLVIFKGDLNYRKLLNDVNWEYTASFKDCLQGFHPTNVCALRTNKADLICGLSEDVVQRFRNQSTDWLISGELGIIQIYSKSD